MSIAFELWSKILKFSNTFLILTADFEDTNDITSE